MSIHNFIIFVGSSSLCISSMCAAKRATLFHLSTHHITWEGGYMNITFRMNECQNSKTGDDCFFLNAKYMNITFRMNECPNAKTGDEWVFFNAKDCWNSNIILMHFCIYLAHLIGKGHCYISSIDVLLVHFKSILRMDSKFAIGFLSIKSRTL